MAAEKRQDVWEHPIAKTARITGPKGNLTFRKIITQPALDNRQITFARPGPLAKTE